MATRVISTSIKLDGESEFKKQLSSVNGELRNLKSEMQLTTAQFKGQANTVEALTAKDELLRREIAQQQEKVKALEQAVQDSADAYGDADSRTDKYRQSLNRAKTDLINMTDELEDNSRYLDEAKASSDKTAKSIDKFGKEVKDTSKEVKDASDEIDKFGKEVKDASDDLGDSKSGLSDLVDGLGTLKNAVVGGAIVTGVKELGEALFEVVDASAEYRSILGTLEISSQNAGYSAEETAVTYGRLQSVLGDTQTAATATANLQAIQLAQEDLMFMTDAAIGAWATYGDSIPIDGLSEAINETIQAGKVTGTFADVLNWAGTSEDDFNLKLEAANSSTERANIVMQELARQGLAEAGQAWIDTNSDIVAMNESQEKWNAAMAGLGETLSPAADALRNFGADAIEWVTEKIKSAVEWIQSLISWFKEINAQLNADSDARIQAAANASNARIDGSHASGLDYVPYDNYLALLHKGERVQTASEAALYRTAPRQSNGGGAVTKSELQDVANQAAARATASNKGQDVVVNVTMELDGATLARKQYRFNQSEAQRHGKPLVNT